MNTGGSQLSDQELRNVILMMVNPHVYRWTELLATNENFQDCIALSDRMLSERYDLELVTRFLVFRNLEEDKLRSIGDIGEFLTDGIVELADPDKFRQVNTVEEEAFRGTFAALAESLGDGASEGTIDAGRDIQGDS